MVVFILFHRKRILCLVRQNAHATLLCMNHSRHWIQKQKIWVPLPPQKYYLSTVAISVETVAGDCRIVWSVCKHASNAKYYSLSMFYSSLQMIHFRFNVSFPKVPWCSCKCIVASCTHGREKYTLICWLQKLMIRG